MRVIGTIVEEESGKPLAGLEVRAYDKDVLWDDKMGTTTTGADGSFRIDYDPSLNAVIVLETTPELYIKVFDESGKKLLYSSKKSIRKEPQVEEVFHVKIPKAKLAQKK